MKVMNSTLKGMLAAAMLAQAAISSPALAQSPASQNPPSESGKAFSLGGPLGQVKTVTFPNGTEVTLSIRYGPIDPTSFEALLNGHDVSANFYPQPETHESVRLPFDTDNGRNRLRLRAVTRPSGVVQIIEREINFAEATVIPQVQTRKLSAEEMARLDALMKRAKEEDIPSRKRIEFLRRHGLYGNPEGVGGAITE